MHSKTHGSHQHTHTHSSIKTRIFIGNPQIRLQSQVLNRDQHPSINPYAIRFCIDTKTHLSTNQQINQNTTPKPKSKYKNRHMHTNPNPWIYQEPYPKFHFSNPNALAISTIQTDPKYLCTHYKKNDLLQTHIF